MTKGKKKEKGGGRQRGGEQTTIEQLKPMMMGAVGVLVVGVVAAVLVAGVAPAPAQDPTPPQRKEQRQRRGERLATGAEEQPKAHPKRPPAEPLLKFSDWAWERKIRMDGMIPRWREEYGWGLFARRDIKDMVLLAVPPWAMLSEDDVMGAPPADGGAAWPRSQLAAAAEAAGLSATATPTFLLVLRLLTLIHPPDGHPEAVRGAEYWQPYVGLLPTPRTAEPFQLPMFMPDRDAAMCLPADMAGRRAAQLAEVRSIRDAVSHASLWNGGSPPFSDDEVWWAYGVVYTRSMTLPGAPQTKMIPKAVLVPAGDIFNQDFNSPQTEWGLNATHGFVATTKPGVEIAKGEQVFIDYRSGNTAFNTLEQFGYVPSEGYPRVITQVGLPIEGPAELTGKAEPVCRRAHNLWVDKATGEMSEQLVWCTVLALLPGRPEAWLYAQGRAPHVVQLSMNISAHQHVHKVMTEHQRKAFEPGESCGAAGPVGKMVLAVSRLMKSDLDAAAAALADRIATLQQQWEKGTDLSRGAEKLVYHKRAEA